MKRCNGCISKDSHLLDSGYEVDVNNLTEAVINTPGIEGITISGGEPYLQSEALVDLLNRIKSKKDLGVILYTGNDFKEIEKNELTNLCDIIIDGTYIESLNDGLSLRGSSNQNICLITKRYTNEVKNIYCVQGRKIELHFMDGKTTMVGIPDKKSLVALSKERSRKNEW